MTGLNPQDKRKHHRIDFNGDIIIHPVMESDSGNVLEVQSNGILARGRDISEEGIRLEIEDTQPPVDILKVKFVVQKYKSVESYARLAWKNDTNYGLNFIALDIDSRNQIRHYISKRK